MDFQQPQSRQTSVTFQAKNPSGNSISQFANNHAAAVARTICEKNPKDIASESQKQKKSGKIIDKAQNAATNIAD